MTNDKQILAAFASVATKYKKLDAESCYAIIPLYTHMVIIHSEQSGLRSHSDRSLTAHPREAHSELLTPNMISVAVMTAAFLPLLHKARGAKSQ